MNDLIDVNSIIVDFLSSLISALNTVFIGRIIIFSILFSFMIYVFVKFYIQK